MSKRVVLVDDSSVIHIQVETVLEGLINSGAITLMCYLNPEEFLGKLRDSSESFDLLITDINMPQMSGLELASGVKQIPALAKKPIFVLTTETDQNLISQAKELTLTGWLVKPPKGEKFIKAIKMALQIR